MDYQKGKIYVLRDIRTNDQPIIYVGSTTRQLSSRLASHRSASKSKPYPIHKYILEELGGWDNVKIELHENYPCENREMLNRREGEIIREFNGNGSLKNIHIAGRTKDEWCEENKDKIVEGKKQYYEANKDDISHKHKQYYEANKDDISHKHKQYYEANKDDIILKSKQYYEANKDKVADYKKQYYEANKDKIADYKKQHYEANKDKIILKSKQRYEANKEAHSNRMKQYREANKEKLRERVKCEACNCEISKASLNSHNKTKKHLKNLATPQQ